MVAHCTKARPVCGVMIGSIWLAMFLMSNSTAVAKDMLINCVSPKGQVDADFTAEVMNPVLIKHGYKPTFQVGQGPVVIEQLRQGKLDGDCGRIEAFNESAGLDLIRVEPAIRRVKFGIWAYDAKFDLHSRLQEAVRLGYLATVQAAPLLAQQMGYTNIHSYESMRSLTEALERGELDAIVNYQAIVSAFNRKSAKKLHRLRHIVTFPVYIYLQQRYQHVVPELSEAIKARLQYRPYEPFPDEEIPPLADDRIIFGCSISKFTQAFVEMEKLYRHAFKSLGYEFQMLPLPRARERAELLGGKLDGTCARGDVAPYNRYRDLIQLQPPVTKMALRVYSREPMKPVTHVNQLPGGSTVAYVRGTQLARLVLQRAPLLQAEDVTTAEIGIKMLAAGRVDYFLGLSGASDYVLNHLDIRKMLFVASDLQPLLLYPYINVRHKALHEPLQRYFRENMTEFSDQVVLPYLPDLIDVEDIKHWENNLQ